MPVYKITAPDGKALKITAPDGASQEEVLAYAQAQYKPQAKPDFSNVQAGFDTTEKPSMLQQAGREVGLGARAMLRGAYSLPGILLDPAMQAAGLPTSAQAADQHADFFGLPEPATAPERVGGDITAALTGGGGFLGAGRALATKGGNMVAQGVGNFLSSMPRTQIASIVGGSGSASVTREAGGGEGAQTLAGLAGGFAPGVATTSGASGLRALMRGGEHGRQLFDQNMRDFRSLGAEPSVGQAAGNSRTRGLESLLAGGPTSSGVMSRAAESQADAIGGGLRGIAGRLSPKAGAEQAGRAVERGVQTFTGNTKAMRRALYWQADQFIPQDTPLALRNTQMTLADLSQPNPGAAATTGALINPKIAQMAQNVADDMAANGGAIPYSAVRELRTKIGEALSDFSLSTDRPTAEYKRLYAALSQDMEEAARRMGPQAEAAAKRANTFTRASADRLEQLERVVDKAGGPEAVYNAVLSGTRDGATTLRAVMQSLPDDGQRALTAAVVKRMGLATPSQQDATAELFSAQTFLTKWGSLSPEARKALFDRHGPKFASDMDKVARVASNLRDGSRVFANPSGTANKTAAYAYAGSLATSAAAAPFVGPLPFLLTVGGGVTAHAMARAMVNPKFVSWLARSTELPASSLPQQLQSLNQLAKDDPDVAEIAAALSRGEQPPQ